jgi:multidrug efflux pump subunit AcrA (membrane-fusion protein)
MRGKWLLISGVAIAAAVAAGALSLRRRPAPAHAPPQPARVAPAPSSDIVLSGKIRARNVVGVGALVAGNIEVFLADIGQEVEAEQVLARVSNQGLETGRELAMVQLDNAQARVTKIEAAITAARLEASRASADAARARDDFDRAEKTYRRQKMLFGEGATPRNTYEKSTHEFESSQTEYDGLAKLSRQADERIQGLLEELRNARKIVDDKQKALDEAAGAMGDAEVRSPVDGVVVGRKGDLGKPAQDQGSDLFQIATDTLQLEVLLEPDPLTIQRLSPGQPALVLISDFQSEGIPATVAKVQQDGIVLVDFTSPNPAIKPGLQADVRIRAGASPLPPAVK